jgi:hypothetical protein
MGGVETAGGYAVEVRIPWSGLGLSPTVGEPGVAVLTIGFDIGVNDDDAPCTDSDPGTRDGELRWMGNGENYQNTSNFGELVLFPRSLN